MTRIELARMGMNDGLSGRYKHENWAGVWLYETAYKACRRVRQCQFDSIVVTDPNGLILPFLEGGPQP